MDFKYCLFILFATSSLNAMENTETEGDDAQLATIQESLLPDEHIKPKWVNQPKQGRVFAIKRQHENNGLNNDGYPFKTPKKTKRAVRTKQDYFCKECGITCHSLELGSKHEAMHNLVKMQIEQNASVVDHSKRLICRSCYEIKVLISFRIMDDLKNHYKNLHQAFDFWKRQPWKDADEDGKQDIPLNNID